MTEDSHAQKRDCDRREFFRGMGRYFSLATLMAATVWVWPRSKLGQAGIECANYSQCRGCKAFKGCTLPAARTVRTAMMKEAP
jgi:hypothetical protein